MERFKLLIEKGGFDALRSLLQKESNLDANCLSQLQSILIYRARELERNRNWVSASEAYALYIDIFAARNDSRIFSSILHCLRQASKFEEANSWQSRLHSDFGFSSGEEWFDNFFLEEKFSSAYENFEKLMEGRKHLAAGEHWLSLFLAVRRALSNGPEQLPILFSTGSAEYSPRKVFVAGFERSGTGAVRAYFNEYPDVYEVPGSEIQTISGPHGLAKFLKCDDKKSIVSTFVDFLRVHAFGLGAIKNALDWKEVSRARILIASVDPVRYASSFHRLFFRLLMAQGKRGVIDACASFFDDFLIAFCKPESTVFFLNNIVNCRNAGEMQVVRNYIYVPVLRDPRDQYASTVQTRRPDLTGEEFVHAFKKTRRMYEAGVGLIDRESIAEIQYEDFVRNEGVRVGLAERAGLGGRAHNRHAVFKPRESSINIGIYKFCNPVEVEVIKLRLKEFCGDL